MDHESGTYRELYPNAPFLSAFEESGLSWCELARRMGMFRTIPDASKVKQMMGVTKDRRTGNPQQNIRYETALKMVEALDLDPVDFGL